MAAPIKAGVKPSFGNDSWGFVTAIADIENPTLDELNAISGYNLSCSLFREQEGLSGTTEKVTLPALLCETDQYEANGSTSWSMSDLSVVLHPQAASGEDGKKAWETLTDGIEGFLWQRQGKPASEELADGDFVNIVPVQLGTKVPGKTSTGADGAYNFTMPVSVTGRPALLVEVVDES